MKKWLACVVSLVFLMASSQAEEMNGLRVTATKTLLEKSKDRDAFNEWDKVEKALGLKVILRNVALQDFPEGTISYVVIVKRWGHTPALYESYKGTAKVPALVRGAESNLTVGKVPMSGYEIGGNRKQFQDSIEGWQLIVTHDSKETLKMTSTGSFDKLLAEAKPARK